MTDYNIYVPPQLLSINIVWMHGHAFVYYVLYKYQKQMYCIASNYDLAIDIIARPNRD